MDKTWMLVKYKTQAGEQAFNGSVVIGFDSRQSSAQEALDSCFSDFFGDRTRKDGLTYRAPLDEYAVSISSMAILDDTDAYVLRKHITYVLA